MCGLLVPLLSAVARPVPVDHRSPYLIDVWETEDGLPEDSATSIVELPDGMWIGTFGGLVRFDGVKFTVLDRSNTPELPSAAIVSMHLDRRGRHWISTDNGIVRRDPDGRWVRFGRDEGWTANYVRNFCESPSGDLILSGFDGHLFRVLDDRLVELPGPAIDPPTPEPPRALRCFFDEHGVLWGANRWFYGRWDGQRWMAVGDEPRRSWDTFDYIAPALDHGVWVSLRTALVHYRDGRETRRIVTSRPIENLWELREEADGTLFGASYEQGLYIIRPDGQVTHFATTNGLSHTSLRFTYRDREQNLWVGSSGGGLMRFKFRNAVTYSHESGLPESITKTIAEVRPGLLIVGTHGKGPYFLEDGLARHACRTSAPSPPDYVVSVAADGQGGAWIGKWESGLAHLQDGVESSPPVAVQPGRTAFALFTDSARRLWVGGDAGISVLDRGEWRRFQPTNGLTAANIRAFAEDPTTHRIYAGAHDSGVFELHENSPDAGRWLLRPGTDGHPVWALHADASGTLWAGTFGGGLLRIRPDSVAAIDERHGLPSRMIYSILEDDLGNLWFGSNRGVLFARKSALNAVANGLTNRLHCVALGIEDGVGSIECSGGGQPSAARDSSGRLWFATLKGVAVIDPRRLLLNDSPPEVLVESATQDNAPVESTSDRRGSAKAPVTHTIRAGTERLEVFYTAPSYVAPNRVEFRTKVEGVDDDWREVGTRRVAIITHPQPGFGRVLIQARNHQGTWNSTSTEFRFNVLPLFWQHWWFSALVGLGLVTAGSAGAWAIQFARRRREAERRAIQDRADLLVRASEERYRSVVATMAEGLLVIDTDFAIQACNPSAARLLHRSVDDLLGKNLVASGWHLLLDDGTPCPESSDPCRRALILGEAVTDAVLGLPRPDGSVASISINARPMFRPGESRPHAAVITVSDITERRLAERASYHLAAIVTSSDDAIIGCDLSGRIVSWNRGAEKVFGFRPEEIIGRPITRLHPSDREAEGGRILAAVQRGERLVNFETVRHTRDGRLIDVSITASPILDAAGTVVGVSKSARDITELKQLQERLRQSQKMESIGHLAGGVAHEFNNILAALLMNLQLSGMHLVGGDAREIQSSMEELCDRATHLVRQLLAFSRQSILRLEPTDLAGFVAQQLRLLAPLLGENVRTHLIAPPDLPWVKADRTALEHVLRNLCLNARDAMQGTGNLNVSLAEEAPDEPEPGLPGGRYVCLSVADDGSGMDDATKRRLFEPFFTTKDVGKGTGLGLAMVRGIVEQHHGTIAAESTLGRGTVFRVYLPAVPPVPGPSAPTRDNGDHRRGTILVVEDDTSLRRATRLSLGRLGYNVVEAVDAESGLALFRQHRERIDLLLTDMVMPGPLTGSQLVSTALAERPGLPVIVTSGYSNGLLEPESASPLGHSSVRCLPKPCPISTLAATIQECLTERPNPAASPPAPAGPP